MINVSGWKDEDGEGGNYKSYFIKANNYTVSNIKVTRRVLVRWDYNTGSELDLESLEFFKRQV